MFGRGRPRSQGSIHQKGYNRIATNILRDVRFYPRQLFTQIVDIEVEETLLLDEVAEHQSIEHHRGVPLLILVLLRFDAVINPRDVLGKAGVLLAETGIE